ncbi:MAG: hypothetical protein JSS45_11760 [Proteobacteria bacterium]|nr:hypothetical protein [Pseudomonadota bacterium]
MTCITEFLQRVGANAQWHDADSGALDRIMDEAALDPLARAAIHNFDRAALEALSGSRTIAHKNITTGKDDEDEDDVPDCEDEDVRRQPHACIA